MGLTAKVNNSFEFEVSPEAIANVDAIYLSENKLHIIQDYRSFHVEIVKSDFNSKSYTIVINNATYEVELKNELDQLIGEMGFNSGLKHQIRNITAPMPGLILDIAVTAGQQVKEGDTLLILEAMKMENSLTASFDGVIKSIPACKGDTVDKDQLLIEFE